MYTYIEMNGNLIANFVALHVRMFMINTPKFFKLKGIPQLKKCINVRVF